MRLIQGVKMQVSMRALGLLGTPEGAPSPVHPPGSVHPPAAPRRMQSSG